MIRRHAWGLLVLAAVLAGLALRVVDLEARPIHHDEAVNWFLFGAAARRGVIYTYDPANYHGPLHFQLGALVRLASDALWAMRLPLALAGTATVALVGLVRRLGPAGTATAAWLLAVSPTMVYFSRDAIHELYLALFTMTLLAAALAWWARPSRALAAAAGASVGAMLAIKETLAITLASLAVGAALAWWRTGRPRPPVEALRAHLGPALAGGAAVVVLSFTSLLRDLDGLLHLVQALSYWTPRGVEGGGHAKPTRWFFDLLLRWELPLLLLAPAGAIVAWARRDGVGLLLAGWGLSTFAVYSLISYKTPWLAVQIVLPLALMAGVAGQAILGGASRVLTGAGLAVLATLCGVQGYEAVRVSLWEHDVDEHALVYVQTHRELRDLMPELQALRRELGEDTPIVSYHRARYPLNYWLRHDRFQAEDPDPLPDVITAPIVLVSPRDERAVLDRLDHPVVRRQVRFRDGLRLTALVDAALADRLPPGWAAPEPSRPTLTVPPRPAAPAPGLVARWYAGRAPRVADPTLETPWFGEDRAWADEASKPIPAPFYVVHEGWLRVDAAGAWTFATTSDDGSRLWIDGRLVVDNWERHPTRTVARDVTLTPGLHHVRLDWFDVGGGAVLEVRWAPRGGELAPIPAAHWVH